ncbi:MAG: LVIVD repeat-containing protein [Vicinamibacterales bacterium]
MRSVASKVFALAAVVVSLAVAGSAQQKPMDPKDPRTGLKPGLRDAGVAAMGMELVSTRPRAEGFYDPTNPAGEALPAERPAGAPAPAPPAQPAAPAPGAAPRPPAGPGALDFANSDIAFSGQRMVIGNFHGFNAYDIESAKSPRLLASVVCPGGQGDVSIYGNLLFMSVEQTRGRIDCGVQGVPEPVSKERFRGVRIFDITDITKPRQVAAVQTCRGSHTHTLVPKDKQTLYVYGSGTGGVRSGEELQDCSGGDPKENANTALFSIDVIEVPLGAPEKARVVNRPRIFADEKTGAIAGLNPGGDSGPGTQRSATTNQCHDITVFPEIGLAAGACSGNGILLDISDPANPKRLDHVADKNFAYWHSATFNNDGTKVIFTDEWGGGTRPRCRATDLPNWGANAIFEIVDKKMKFGGYYKMPAAQTETENCVAHNGSLIPVPGRDIMVQGWYQGGVSVFDFTDAANPVEIAYFDRGPLDAKNLIVGGYWSTYWYNGHLYGSEISRGMDIFKLVPTQYLSQNEIDAATQWRLPEFNAQNQPLVKFEPTTAVARSYLDQLNRSKGISAARAKAVVDGLDKVDELRTGKERNAAAALEALDAVAAQLAADAKAASGRDAMRLQALSETLKGRTARLR